MHLDDICHMVDIYYCVSSTELKLIDRKLDYKVLGPLLLATVEGLGGPSGPLPSGFYTLFLHYSM